MGTKADGWRNRLDDAVKASGRSRRAISLAAGFAENYLIMVIDKGRNPSVENLVDLCSAIGVSPVWVILGHDITPEDERIVRALQDNPQLRSVILAALSGESKA